MNPEELEKFKQLLAAYEQALPLQRMRERTIETYRQYLWKVAKHFNRCPDNLSADGWFVEIHSCQGEVPRQLKLIDPSTRKNLVLGHIEWGESVIPYRHNHGDTGFPIRESIGPDVENDGPIMGIVIQPLHVSTSAKPAIKIVTEAALPVSFRYDKCNTLCLSCSCGFVPSITLNTRTGPSILSPALNVELFCLCLKIGKELFSFGD